jgi:hypothetical protein
VYPVSHWFRIVSAARIAAVQQFPLICQSPVNSNHDDPKLLELDLSKESSNMMQSPQQQRLSPTITLPQRPTARYSSGGLAATVARFVGRERNPQFDIPAPARFSPSVAIGHTLLRVPIHVARERGWYQPRVVVGIPDKRKA